ncbi:hypothetical protein B0T18DRAFT_404768 [Schizothecium vesticola]|uniref:Uncharacterized protein n=1 Tax=Schizothecium vesticola TaxID=314040 RepID=A0AA40F720_9PEZI|nr:hypothetical protein B0T18DRAFT_404768 [Schizothecium vesticola]
MAQEGYYQGCAGWLRLAHPSGLDAWPSVRPPPPSALDTPHQRTVLVPTQRASTEKRSRGQAAAISKDTSPRDGGVSPYQVAPPLRASRRYRPPPLICDRKHDGGGVTNWSQLVRRDAAATVW